MRYKIFILLFLVFVLLYIYLDNLNPQSVRLYIGYGKYYETSISGFVVLSFILGILVAIVIGLFFDLKRVLDNWRQNRKQRRMGEFTESFEKAKAYVLRGDKEKAIESLNRLIRRNPDIERPYTYLANIYISTKELDNALDILRQAQTNLGKKESILFKKARVNKELKNLKDAEVDLKEILTINESNIGAMNLLRDIYVEQRDWDNAYEIEKNIRRFVKNQEENRRFIGIRYERLLDAYSKGREENSEKIMKELKEIIGEDKRFVPAYLLLAEVYKKMGKLNEAGRVYGRGYTKTGHIIFLLKMEDLYIDRGDPGVILKIYRRIMDMSPKNRLITFLYARLCLRLEMIDEAIDMLNALIVEGIDFGGLHRAMAEAYIHRGEIAKAVEEFRRAFPIEKVYIPFRCDNCNSSKEEWQDFCTTCFSWNTINVRTEDFLKSVSGDSSELRVIYEMNEWDKEETIEDEQGY
ncbi:MAG TPA: tetratricopeptide repeat protein [Syntrophorhabdaceae bacterium]|nr:tetratricopeptide repeat protein [Syntrophorhabdaceae bacterium]HOL05763.1 tetratricopeptide repeat protein [Syntrophorhabdaceae bacterium]HON85582.1 tetratricopeptide repeat protein [Syntrophorhabdaceae bacterium]HOT42439.1 tetratricopeptide repeat protein [Syntrophorhabdaceae bacterium]HPC66503.1 tetratricopeptide repeat protein [Syntrophorhabdaceae bacterium]